MKRNLPKVLALAALAWGVTTSAEGATPHETICSTPAPLPSGTCEVAGSGSDTLLVGTVLAPDHIYRGGQVLIDSGGDILCVGCDCDNGSARLVTCPTAVISPGLINPHDHLAFNHNLPWVDTGERWEHRHDWRGGLPPHSQISTPLAGNSLERRQWGELRHLLGGTTSLLGSASASGFVRNLDNAADDEGLAQDNVDYDTFPLGDDGMQYTQIASGCGYPAIFDLATLAPGEQYLAHVAEGINDYARNEFACVMGPADDLVEPQSAFVHMVGMTLSDYDEVATGATELVWSPRSNISLYGETARVTTASYQGATISLGTDWLRTGSMNLLRELRCADSFNDVYLDGFFSDYDLWQMVTRNPAVATGTDDVIGGLVPGHVADIAIFDASTHSDYRAIIEAEPEDVALVLRDGIALYGDEAVVSSLLGHTRCEILSMCSVLKRLCLSDELGTNMATLQAAVGSVYPLFFCGGEPVADEPTCIPKRSQSYDGSTIYSGGINAQDKDGDGIGIGDNCPNVFNPIRPLDRGVQADSDGDGIGDACDATFGTVVPSLAGPYLLALAALLLASSLALLRSSTSP